MRKLLVAAVFMAFNTSGFAGEEAHPPVPTKKLDVYMITPCRLIDTRVQDFVVGGGVSNRLPFKDGETREYLIQASGVCPFDDPEAPRPVPLGAKGLIVTITAVDATDRGHLILYDPTLPWYSPLSRPLVSTINFTPNTNIANTTFTILGQEMGLLPLQEILPDMAVYARVQGGGTVHVVVDVLGYLR